MNPIVRGSIREAWETLEMHIRDDEDFRLGVFSNLRMSVQDCLPDSLSFKERRKISRDAAERLGKTFFNTDFRGEFE